MFRIYTIDERCLPAVEQVRQMYRSHSEWSADITSGKMFGVLVYDFAQLVHGGGYLAAFSGTLGGKTIQPGFVPPVYDLMGPDSRFVEEEKNISEINRKLDELQKQHAGIVRGADGRLIAELRHERKVRSQELQQWLFDQYIFYNIKGVGRRTSQLFATRQIPSGTGDCCAPKLLQEAFRQGVKPLAIVEWNSADNHFYPPCMERCYPLLRHMLDGLDAEPDPRMQTMQNLAKQLKVVYEDDYLMLVDKPSGLLSVPGKEFYPNVEELTGALIVHRLDQDTSGLMLLAKDRTTQSVLQRQFERREIHKVYSAILEKPEHNTSGVIRLPLRADIANRPRQIVDVHHGKPSVTHYQLIDNTPDGHAKVLLYPETGRTHQLRVHCSDARGLDNPILGDRLYGHAESASRLMLHAQSIEFLHPQTGQNVHFTSEAPWPLTSNL